MQSMPTSRAVCRMPSNFTYCVIQVVIEQLNIDSEMMSFQLWERTTVSYKC